MKPTTSNWLLIWMSCVFTDVTTAITVYNTTCTPPSPSSNNGTLPSSLASDSIAHFCHSIRPRVDKVAADQLPLPTIYNSNMEGSGDIRLGFQQYVIGDECEPGCKEGYEALFGVCGGEKEELRGNGTINAHCGYFTFEVLKSDINPAGANDSDTSGARSGLQIAVNGGWVLSVVAVGFSLL